MKGKKCLKTVLVSAACIYAALFASRIPSTAATTITVTQTDATSNSATFSWTKDEDAYGYDILYSTDKVNWKNTKGDTDSICETEETSFTIGNLYKDSVYYVKVVPVEYDRAIWDYTERTEQASEVTKVVTTPSVPSSVDVWQTGATTKTVTFSWEAIPKATGYRIYKYGSFDLIKTVSGTTATVSAGEDNGGDYTIRAIWAYESFTAEEGNIDAMNMATLSQPINVGSVSKNYLSWDSDRVTVKWDRKEGSWGFYNNPDGYKIVVYSLSGKRLKTYDLKNGGANSFSFHLKAVDDAGFKIKVGEYMDFGGKKYYSWSSVKTVVPQAKLATENVGKKSVKLKWKKVKNAVSYAIYERTNSGSYGAPIKGKKIKTVGKNVTSCTLKNIRKSGKSIEIYVVPTVKVNGKKITAEAVWTSLVSQS